MNTCAGNAGSVSQRKHAGVEASAGAACARPPTRRHREDTEGNHLDAAPQQDEHRNEVPYGKAYRAQAYDHGVFPGRSNKGRHGHIRDQFERGRARGRTPCWTSNQEVYMRRVTVMSLETLLSDDEHVEFVHCDCQGQEFNS